MKPSTSNYVFEFKVTKRDHSRFVIRENFKQDVSGQVKILYVAGLLDTSKNIISFSGE